MVSLKASQQKAHHSHEMLTPEIERPRYKLFDRVYSICSQCCLISTTGQCHEPIVALLFWVVTSPAAAVSARGS